MKRFELSKNPFRILAGRVRYRTGLWVNDFTEAYSDSFDWSDKNHKIRRAIWEYGVGSEGAANCIEMPLLGKIIKWENRKYKTLHRWVEARNTASTDKDHKKVQKLWNRMKHEEAMMDKWLKFEDPLYVTREEENEDQLKHMRYLNENGRPLDAPMLIHGTRRLTNND